MKINNKIKSIICNECDEDIEYNLGNNILRIYNCNCTITEIERLQKEYHILHKKYIKILSDKVSYIKYKKMFEKVKDILQDDIKLLYDKHRYKEFAKIFYEEVLSIEKKYLDTK